MTRRQDVVRKAVQALKERRRAAGLCIQDPSLSGGGTPHAAPTRNKRRSDGGFDFCESCYQTKLESKRRIEVTVGEDGSITKRRKGTS